MMIPLFRFLICSGCFFSFLLCDCVSKSTTKQSGSMGNKEVKELSTDDLNVAILYFVNVYRKSIGRAPIQPNSLESEIALQHSTRMARGIIPFGHDGFAARIRAIEKQIGPSQENAENVAFGKMTAREVVDAWLHSPIHRRNIEGNFLLTGVGCAKSNKGVLYYTEIFTR